MNIDALSGDGLTVHRLHRQMLEGDGFDVSAWVDGQEELDMVTAEDLDLMILDRIMHRLGWIWVNGQDDGVLEAPLIEIKGHFSEEVGKTGWKH